MKNPSFSRTVLIQFRPHKTADSLVYHHRSFLKYLLQTNSGFPLKAKTQEIVYQDKST